MKSNLTKYKVIVRRRITEDTVVEIEATSPENAVDIAIDEATVIPQDKWDAYDCEYLSDIDDVYKVVTT